MHVTRRRQTGNGERQLSAPNARFILARRPHLLPSLELLRSTRTREYRTRAFSDAARKPRHFPDLSRVSRISRGGRGAKRDRRARDRVTAVHKSRGIRARSRGTLMPWREPLVIKVVDRGDSAARLRVS